MLYMYGTIQNGGVRLSPDDITATVSSCQAPANPDMRWMVLCQPPGHHQSHDSPRAINAEKFC